MTKQTIKKIAIESGQYSSLRSGAMKATFRKTKIEPFSTCEFSVKGMKGIAAKGQTSRCRKIELHQTGIILHPEDETLKAGRAPSADGVARLCGYSNWAQMRDDLVTDDKPVMGSLMHQRCPP